MERALGLLNETLDKCSSLHMDGEVRASQVVEDSWTSPLSALLMININAATKEGKNVIAMVVRDCVSGIIDVATCGTTGLSYEVAVPKTLLWAVDMVKQHEWESII